MLAFSKILDPLHVPERRLTRTLDRILGQVIREAARTWLRVVVTEVPVETGMAKGALQPLGRFLRVAVPITPRRKPYYSKLEGSTVDIASGVAKSEFELRSENFDYEFSWSTDVLHYWLREFYNGPATPGEDVLIEAEEAFQEYLAETIENRVPQSIQSFIEIQ